MAVDMGRRPYSTTCRPFRDSDVTVTLRWLPALRAAGCLPVPSKINSLDWSTWFDRFANQSTVTQTVGEVPGTTRAYNGAEAIPYAKGLDPCEHSPTDFAQGEEHDPDRPPAEFDDLGFPICCVNHFTADGGLLFDSSAPVATPVVPGDTCLTAPGIVPGETANYHQTLAHVVGWVELVVPDGYNASVTLLSEATSATGFAHVWGGSGCGDAFPVGPNPLPVGTPYLFTGATGSHWWVRCELQVFGTYDATISLS